MILLKDNILYRFRFGLKGLMLFNDLSYLNEDIKLLQYYAGFITDQPNMSLQDVKSLIMECSDSEIILLDEYIEKYFKIQSPLEIKELYIKIVGEMGIAPFDFYQMTLEEIESAYEGFKRRLEIDANLYLMALHKRNDKNADIRLVEDKGYTIGSLSERKQTFQNLNIKED